MHKIVLDDTDLKDLRFHLERSSCPQVRLRCITLLIRSMGIGQAEIAQTFGVATSSQTNWARLWKNGGLKALIETRYKGRVSSISKEQQESLSNAFEQNPPGTLAEAREEIATQTGKRFSLEGVRKLLQNKLKLKRRKAKQVPPRCDDPKKKRNKRSGVPTN
jgi:transposase